MARIKYYDPGTNEWKYADSNIIRGGIDYYEQPEAPESAPVGSLWYDTDEEAAESPAPGGNVDPEQIAAAVNKWLDEHPEATTTVKWGNISAGEIFELSTEEEPAIPVPCTGITLDKTELAFSDTETTVVLQATVTPFDTTDQIEWSVSKTGVVTVENGVVKGIANGSCVITAKCGAYSATCSVTVNIIVSYTKANLAAMYDLTMYEDGYLGEVEDLSGNGVVPTVTGQEAYPTNHCGFVGGKFMINHDNNYSPSSFTIPANEVFQAYPFTVEMYIHPRANYNWYASDGATPSFSVGVTGAPSNATDVFTTRSRGTGINFQIFTNKVYVGRTTSASFAVTLEEPLIIDGVTDTTTITDTYYHFVVCIDQNNQAIYINGVKVNTEVVSWGDNIVGGDMQFFPNNLKADLKLIRLYDAFLTDEQVANNYSNTIAVYGGEA